MRNLRQLLSFLAGELANSHGQRFFAQMCEALGVYLNARGVMITEWLGPAGARRARPLAYWLAGRQIQPVEYALAGTPCYQTNAGKMYVHRRDVGKLFADDEEVQREGIESYVGVPFADENGQVIGHLALFDVVPRQFPANELDAIRIASVRAGAEVHRLMTDRMLAATHRRYRNIVNRAAEAILLWSDDRVIDCNDTASQLFGASREELLGKTMHDLSPSLQADGSPTAQHVEHLFQLPVGMPAIQWRHQRLDGRTFDCELIVQSNEVDGRRELVTLSRDISQRLKGQAALVRSENTLAAVLEHSPVPMLVCGVSGVVEIVNRQFESLFGYTISDVPTLDHWWKLAFPDVEVERNLRCEWYQRLVEAHASGRQVCRPIEATITCVDGSTRYVQIKCVQVGERQLATMLDMTEQHDALSLAQQARRAAEAANEAKDQFLAALSHELRTPLTPVLIAATQLQTFKDLPPEAASLVDVVRRNSEMEARLIEDLLDVARISNGKLQLHRQSVNVHDAISASLQICWSEIGARRLEIVQELGAAHCYSHADPARLQQVFWNLLKNAVKFTKPGGRITIRSSNMAVPGDASAMPELVVEVTDSGVGMTRDTMARLFTAFHQGTHTRQFGGLGLGLSITRQIVAMHGGRVQASSDGPGKGSTFVVTLPTCPPPAERPPVEKSARAPQRQDHQRILLVEDHESTGRLLTGVLQQFGHDVIWAQSVSQAQDLLEHVNGFDLLLSDLGLPDGSGLEIMPVFHRRTGRPGIAFSGYGTDQDIRKTQDAGFALHLIKPVDVHRLREAISSLAAKA